MAKCQQEMDESYYLFFLVIMIICYMTTIIISEWSIGTFVGCTMDHFDINEVVSSMMTLATMVVKSGPVFALNRSKIEILKDYPNKV